MILEFNIAWNFIPILSCLDVIITYIIVKSSNKPELELNEIARFLWKKLGLKKGTLIMGVSSITIVTIISYYLVFMRYIFFGMFGVALYLHYNNLYYLHKEGKLYVKRKNV